MEQKRGEGMQRFLKGGGGKLGQGIGSFKGGGGWNPLTNYGRGLHTVLVPPTPIHRDSITILMIKFKHNYKILTLNV